MPWHGGSWRAGTRRSGSWQAVTHPNWDAYNLNNDITLLKLSSPAQLGSRVAPVCLAPANLALPSNLQCVTTGWGRTNTNCMYPAASVGSRQATLPLAAGGRRRAWPCAATLLPKGPGGCGVPTGTCWGSTRFARGEEGAVRLSGCVRTCTTMCTCVLVWAHPQGCLCTGTSSPLLWAACTLPEVSVQGVRLQGAATCIAGQHPHLGPASGSFPGVPVPLRSDVRVLPQPRAVCLPSTS